MIDTETGEILASFTGIGEETIQTSGIVLAFEFGTEGFNQMTIGISMRKADNQIAIKFAEA